MGKNIKKKDLGLLERYGSKESLTVNLLYVGLALHFTVLFFNASLFEGF